MYISISALILLAIIGLIIGFIHYMQNTPQSKIKRLEKVIGFIHSRILEPPFEKLFIPDADELVRALRKTEKTYSILREHYENDWDKQLELVNDWYEYCNALRQLKSSLDRYIQDEEYGEAIGLPMIKIEEIESKFEILLKGLRYAD